MLSDNHRIIPLDRADCLRCDFLPECYMALRAIRERRRILCYRRLLVPQMVRRKNRCKDFQATNWE